MVKNSPEIYIERVAVKTRALGLLGLLLLAVACGPGEARSRIDFSVLEAPDAESQPAPPPARRPPPAPPPPPPPPPPRAPRPPPLSSPPFPFLSLCTRSYWSIW